MVRYIIIVGDVFGAAILEILGGDNILGVRAAFLNRTISSVTISTISHYSYPEIMRPSAKDDRRSSKECPRIYIKLIIDYIEQKKREGYSLGDEAISLDHLLKPGYPVVSLIEDLRQFLEHEVPKNMLEAFGFSVEVKIIYIRPGSIEVMFSMLLDAYSAVEKYKSFVENVEWIKPHVEWLVQTFLDSRFGRLLVANANAYAVDPERRSRRLRIYAYVALPVVISVLLAGFFLVRFFQDQKKMQVAYEQQKELSVKHQPIVEAALSQYSELAASYIQLLSDKEIDSLKIRDLNERSLKLAFKLAMFTNGDLGNKSLEISYLGKRLLTSKLSEGVPDRELELFADIISEWVTLAKVEMQHLNHSPDTDYMKKIEETERNLRKHLVGD